MGNSKAQTTVEELARAAQAGSEAAFEQLVHLTAGRLYRFLRTKGVDEHAAEDLVQETYIRVHGALNRYDPARPFAAWLFTIGARLAVSHWRRQRPETPLLPQDRVVQDHPAAAAARASSADALWERARTALSKDQYEAVWLHYHEAMPVKEVAAVMGKTDVHVKVMLHRARKRLARTLETAEAAPTSVPESEPEGELQCSASTGNG